MQKWKREIKQNTDYHFKLQNDTVCTCKPLIVANTGFLHTKYKLVLVITQTKNWQVNTNQITCGLSDISIASSILLILLKTNAWVII